MLCQRALATGLTFSLHEFAARVGDREIMLDCRVALLDNEHSLVLEFLDTERDRRVRREADLVAQQRLSRRIIRQLAHEVKNPLGGLRGAAQLLERQLPDPEQKAYTRVIIEEADRLAALVDGILRAGGAPRQEEINLHRITEHVAQLIEAEKPAGVELVRDYDPSLPSITVDRNQMIQAFLNVGAQCDAGARRARPADLPHAGTDEFHGRRRAPSVGAVRRSRGQRPRHSRRAQGDDLLSARDRARPTGTGLGLTIAQDLVSRNGGLIEFTSEPGRTVFQIRLPVANGGRR